MNYGRYHIQGELGSGAMGLVYRAHDPQIDRLVALKVLRQDRVTSEEFVYRFLKEAKAIGRLSHPNIVTVYDAGQDHETIYIAMEFLEGKPLNEVIQERRLSVQEVMNIGVHVAEALDYAHSQGIVHRDIKPSNIFVTSFKRPIITDFGIARIDDPSSPHQTQAGAILGTPLYMSPEQVMGKTVDGRSDLYSLGVILYELATGKNPFRGKNIAAIFRAILEDTPAEPVKTDSSVPQVLSELIMKSIEKMPDKRFQTGRGIAERLKTFQKRRKSDLSPERRIEKKSQHYGLLAFIAFAVIVVGIGFLYYLVAWEKPETPAKSALDAPSRKETAYVVEKKPEIISPSGVQSPTIDETRSIEKSAMQAVLKVGSSPIGAQVFMDDSFKGKTPLELELPFGKYEIRV
ncbi:MAG: serine/threonine protein kinase, partial [Desulfobacteraceae bacterium]|nr:serine/threonine protein kinase [Desulfobacteraceae bacterium]